MKEMMQRSAVFGGSFLAVMLGIVIYLGANRMVVIADTGSIAGLMAASESGELPGHKISLLASAEKGVFLKIPMEHAIGSENITVENQYASRRLVVRVRGATGFFYDNSRITGYVESVQDASYVADGEGVTLYLQLSELYEYESILNKGYLQVNLYKPLERYAKVVLLDAGEAEGLDAQAKEALRRIEDKLQALLEVEGVRVYSADVWRESARAQETKQLIEETRASLYVGLKFDSAQDAGQFGSYVCYNSLYFRPWYTNGEFADRMEREMVSAIEGRALGLVEVEDGILRELSIPAVTVCPGFLSHETEGKLLLKESYQDRIAAGLCAGILGAYGEMESGGETAK